METRLAHVNGVWWPTHVKDGRRHHSLHHQQQHNGDKRRLMGVRYMASAANTVEHGGQLGMLFELLRNCIGSTARSLRGSSIVSSKGVLTEERE
jgi:hypothetical protein